MVNVLTGKEGRGGVRWRKAEFRPTFGGRYQNVSLDVSLDVWEKLCVEDFFFFSISNFCDGNSLGSSVVCWRENKMWGRKW